MPRYRIRGTREANCVIEVEAESDERAREIAREKGRLYDHWETELDDRDPIEVWDIYDITNDREVRPQALHTSGPQNEEPK